MLLKVHSKIFMQFGFFKLRMFMASFVLDVGFDVGSALVKWIYSDVMEVNSNSDFLLSLLKSAGCYQLSPLMIR